MSETADSRSPASSSERQLLRKLPFRIEISVAIADPIETPMILPDCKR